jgi:peptidoglycan/LPS O-acetylase OafA/YrhL
MAIEETWRGHPMIDEPTHLWIIAACLVAAAFLLGGAVAGHRRPSAASGHAAVAAGLAVAVLIVAGVVRRLWLAREGVPYGVARLWCLGAVAALLLSAAGSLLGRRLSTQTHGPAQFGNREDPGRTAP